MFGIRLQFVCFRRNGIVWHLSFPVPGNRRQWTEAYQASHNIGYGMDNG